MSQSLGGAVVVDPGGLTAMLRLGTTEAVTAVAPRHVMPIWKIERLR